MATRRRYKAREHAAPVNVAVASPEIAPASPVDDDPVQRAVEAHAEALQHQHAQRQQAGLPEPQIDAQQRQQIDAYVDAVPGISDWKRRFLKSHPSLLAEPFLRSMSHAYHLALQAGVPDDTPQMDHAILAGVARDIEHHRALAGLARPMPEDVVQAAQELHREAEAHLALQEPPASPPPPKRTMPMSAPVSRDVQTTSGQRGLSSTVTLTPEEVQIARNSFTDPSLTNAQKELLYAQNKRRYARMRADGSYSDQGGRG